MPLYSGKEQLKLYTCGINRVIPTGGQQLGLRGYGARPEIILPARVAENSKTGEAMGVTGRHAR